MSSLLLNPRNLLRLRPLVNKAAMSMSSASGTFRPPTSQMSNLMDIGSRDIFDSDHDIFRENARRFFRENLVPQFAEFEKNGEVSREFWRGCGENGLLGVNIPADAGGIGATFIEAAIVGEEHSYTGCLAPAMSLHSDIVMPYIVNYGSPEQIKQYIPDMTAGKKISAIAMTEPNAGSDLQGIKTTAKKVGDDYIINGSKIFITNGWLADVVLVVCMTDPNAKSAAHGLSVFIVEEGMPGFKKGRKLKKMGFDAQDTAELFFDDVRVPASAMVGEINHGFYYLMNELPQERLLVALGATAHMEWMFEEARRYTSERKVFGKPVNAMQTVQHKLAELKTQICVARSFTDECIKLHNEKKLDTGMASMAKYWLSDLQNKVAYECVQLHGGMGYMRETPICRAYVDARVQPIYAGSNEIMKELIARPIVGKDKRKK